MAALPLAASTGRLLRILLAEDDKINQQLVTMLLRKADHQVDVVENGALAVEAVRTTGYDLVLMDVQMPVLDGGRGDRTDPRSAGARTECAIIALTAHAMTGAKEEYLAAEMDDYLSKPIDIAELFLRLSEVAAGVVGRAPKPAPADADHPGRLMIDPARLEMIAG